jgi:hypothetical protein
LETEGLLANVLQLATASHLEPSGMGPGEDIADGQEIYPRDLDEVVEIILSADDGTVCFVGNLGLGFFRRNALWSIMIFCLTKIDLLGQRGGALGRGKNMLLIIHSW